MVGIRMRVGPKGQVVIPQQIREDLAIYPGSEVVFDYDDETIVIKRQQKKIAHLFSSIHVGNKKIPTLTDEYEERMRKSKKRI